MFLPSTHTPSAVSISEDQHVSRLHRARGPGGRCLCFAIVREGQYSRPWCPSLTETKNLSCQDSLRKLQRDLTGYGFTHIGSDGVARTFDRSLHVIDAAPLDVRSTHWERVPGASVLDEARAAFERSQQEAVGRSSSPRHALIGRQESCVSENCPNDMYCQGLSIYGYNCTSCLIVSDGIGNCQEF